LLDDADDIIDDIFDDEEATLLAVVEFARLEFVLPVTTVESRFEVSATEEAIEDRWLAA